MNSKLRELATEAGFCFYTKEEDKNEPLDWSCDYTDDIQRLYYLIKAEERIATVKIVLKMLESMHNCSNGSHNYYKHVSAMIEADFKVKL
tara:strand:- start:442 stop:711 length:270 start_codon:yes stop_codon:yes gene_type:complete